MRTESDTNRGMRVKQMDRNGQNQTVDPCRTEKLAKTTMTRTHRMDGRWSIFDLSCLRYCTCSTKVPRAKRIRGLLFSVMRSTRESQPRSHSAASRLPDRKLAEMCLRTWKERRQAAQSGRIDAVSRKTSCLRWFAWQTVCLLLAAPSVRIFPFFPFMAASTLASRRPTFSQPNKATLRSLTSKVKTLLEL